MSLSYNVLLILKQKMPEGSSPSWPIQYFWPKTYDLSPGDHSLEKTGARVLILIDQGKEKRE